MSTKGGNRKILLCQAVSGRERERERREEHLRVLCVGDRDGVMDALFFLSSFCLCWALSLSLSLSLSPLSLSLLHYMYVFNSLLLFMISLNMYMYGIAVI